MMSTIDAERLLDENFIALDESNPFDPLDNNGFGDVKFRKKSGFNFSSTWRKPKIGRRKSKAKASFSKKLDSFDMTFNDDFNGGKYVKGRESFESFASIPLSEFDEAKDMLPFLNLRNDALNTKKSTKEKTAFNPKMFLSQPSVNRTEIKNKFKKERAKVQKMENEESDDVFKPIHNKTDNVFDAFQILPKESPEKVKLVEETKPKQKEEQPEDQYDKENSTSFYGGDLYQDHGPILSSLSEDTSLHSDSIQGVQFLEDEPKWNPLLNPNFEEEEEKTWFDMNNGESVKSNGKVKTSVGSFSERVRKFQSKDTMSVRSSSSKSSASSKISDILGPRVASKREEATITRETSEEEIDAELDNLDKLVASAFSDSGSKATEESNPSRTVTSKSSAKPYSNKFERNFERIKTYQMNNDTRVSSSSFQENKKKFGTNKFEDDQRKKIFVQPSEKVQSSVVDMSMMSSFKNQATSVPEPSIQKTPITLNVEKGEPTKTWKKSSTSNERPRKSDYSVHSSYSYHTNYRSSISTVKTTNTFESKKFGGRTSKPWETERKPSMENDTTISRSSDASKSVGKFNLDQQDDISVPASIKTPTASETTEKPRDSFLAATALFGGKVESSTKKYGRKFGTNASKSSGVKAIEEKKETTESNNAKDVESSGQDHPVVAKPVVVKKYDFGAKKSIESVKSIESSTSKSVAEKKELFYTKPSVTRKYSIGSESHTAKLGQTKPWMKSDKSTVDTPSTAPSESEDKADAKPATSNESTASTSVSSLTCNSAAPQSFAQQSASIFGVTLKKKRTESTSAAKETVAPKKSIDSVVNLEKLRSISNNMQTVKPVQDVVERKTSTSSISIQSVGKTPETEVKPAKQEETSTVAEEQMNEKQPINPPQKETKSDASVAKVNPVSLPRQTSSRSISNRLKMFEKAAARTRKSYIKNSGSPMRSNSPKSIATSGSLSSVDDLSVATKRRETSGSSSLATKRRDIAGSDFSIATKRTDISGSGITTVPGEDKYISDRRESLKGNTAADSTSKLQSKSFDKSSNELEKPIVLPTTKALTSAPKEENNTKPQETLSKEDAYSMRRKFFENLDRKRMQASMSRPLDTKAEPIQAKNMSDVPEETQTVTDEPSHEDADLPKFVEVEEDFMLRDNISTCLSASESRSVVCKPDALLYSVSQKAIAMMSVKAESSSMRSYTRTYGTQDKGTIDRGIKLNREDSAARFRNRISNKLSTNNETQGAETEPSTEESPAEVSIPATINDAQDDSDKTEEIPSTSDDKKEESTGISSLSIRERRKLFESKSF